MCSISLYGWCRCSLYDTPSTEYVIVYNTNCSLFVLFLCWDMYTFIKSTQTMNDERYINRTSYIFNYWYNIKFFITNESYDDFIINDINGLCINETIYATCIISFIMYINYSYSIGNIFYVTV